MYMGLFPEVAHVGAGREATTSGGLPTRSPYRDKKQPVYVSIFLNDVGLILPLFTCTSQQSVIEINIIIDFDGFAPGKEGDSDSVQLAYVLSSLTMRQVCERMTYQPSSGKAF